MKRLLLLLAILAVGLVVLLVNHGSGETLGLVNDDFARLVMLASFGTLLATGILASRRNIGQSLRYGAMWLLILLALAAAYIYRYDLQTVASRMTAGLVPGYAVQSTSADGTRILVIHKAEGGHFETTVGVNGQSIPMVVDTGASAVVLSYEDALEVGLDPERLTFSLAVSTANGRANAAPVVLDEVAIGAIVRRNVRAMVTERGRLDQSLLGMTFLETLGSVEISRDELRLRD
ncbi:TIGR02281 family clan AA aspartic protease [Sinorhizobium sp. BG8]|uniref:TIGR02281 family clan AA aspartic protease n=1 Tax=Sinorhizobium sp. BG8 TaxID=2613773 RepID=UPI00193D6B80|nr:TIGR02281 family clan AA aspartic protease [Sinorhizobium sp. BG8]QRM55723.1 TIGR02281 family clan AA aspartic protease [Sinorhizobium sp. BG8]